MVILSMEPITEWLTSWIVVGCVGLGLVAVGLMVAMCSGILYTLISDNVMEWLVNTSLCMIAIGVVVGLIGLGGGEITKADTGRYKYEIFLEEGHDVEELTEKYVVKEQKGLIFVIEDRKD